MVEDGGQALPDPGGVGPIARAGFDYLPRGVAHRHEVGFEGGQAVADGHAVPAGPRHRRVAPEQLFVRGGPEAEHLSHLFEGRTRPHATPAVEDQGRLRQPLTEHALAPGDVDQRRVGRQPQQVRLNHHLVAQDQDRHHRKRGPVLPVESISDMFAYHETNDSLESVR